MRPKLPDCYSKSNDPENVLCSGGVDPSYMDNGSHIRPQCDFFEKCHTLTQIRLGEHNEKRQVAHTKKRNKAGRVRDGSRKPSDARAVLLVREALSDLLREIAKCAKRIDEATR